MVYTCIFFFIVTCTLQHSSKHNFVAPIHYTNTWWHQFLLYTSSVCDLASITCVLLMIYWIRDTFCIKNHHFSIVVQKLIWSVPSTPFNFWIAFSFKVLHVPIYNIDHFSSILISMYKENALVHLWNFFSLLFVSFWSIFYSIWEDKIHCFLSHSKPFQYKMSMVKLLTCSLIPKHLFWCNQNIKGMFYNRSLQLYL